MASKDALYVLIDERLVLRCDNPLEWLDWMRNTPRIIEATLLSDDRELVTLFAGYAGDVSNQQPCVFCTLLKPNPRLPSFAAVVAWHCSRHDAVEAHRAYVRQLRNTPECRGAGLTDGATDLCW